MSQTRPPLPAVHHDERGMVGKLAVVWLLVAALMVVAAYDAASIAVTRFQIADVAADAASDAAAALRSGGEEAACDAAQAVIEASDEHIKLKEGWCEADREAERVSITVRKSASTLLAGRLSFTKKLTRVSDTEIVGPSEL